MQPSAVTRRLPAPCARRERYELSLMPGSSNEADGEAAPRPERYSFARCRRPLPAARMAALGVPLPEGERTVVHSDLAWEEIQWGTSGVSLRGQLYPLVRIHFTPQTAHQGAAKAGGAQ